MMLFGEEAKALLKQLEKLFKKLVARIVDFQNDWDRCDPIWRFCWQNRKGKWFETRISYYNGVYFIVNWGESRLWDFWAWEIKPGEFCRENDEVTMEELLQLEKDFGLGGGNSSQLSL